MSVLRPPGSTIRGCKCRRSDLRHDLRHFLDKLSASLTEKHPSGPGQIRMSQVARVSQEPNRLGCKSCEKCNENHPTFPLILQTRSLIQYGATCTMCRVVLFLFRFVSFVPNEWSESTLLSQLEHGHQAKHSSRQHTSHTRSPTLITQ